MKNMKIEHIERSGKIRGKNGTSDLSTILFEKKDVSIVVLLRNEVFLLRYPR